MDPQRQTGKPAHFPWAPPPAVLLPRATASLPAPPLVRLLSLPNAESQEKQSLQVSAWPPWQLSPGYRLTEIL